MEATTSVGSASVRMLQKFLTTMLGLPVPSHHRHTIPPVSDLTDIEDLTAALAAAELQQFSTKGEDSVVSDALISHALSSEQAAVPWLSVESDEALSSGGLSASLPELFDRVAATAKPIKNLATEATVRTTLPEPIQDGRRSDSHALPQAFSIASWGLGSVAITRVGDPAGDPVLMLAGIGGHSGLFWASSSGLNSSEDQTPEGLAGYLAKQGYCCYLIDLDNKGIAPLLVESELAESEMSEGANLDTQQLDAHHTDELFGAARGVAAQDGLRAALNDSLFGGNQVGDIGGDVVASDASAEQTSPTPTGLFKWVTQDLPAVVAWVAEKHPGQRQRWLGHGAGGLVWWALWARYPEFRSQCHAIMQVATSRTTLLAKHKGAVDASEAGDTKRKKRSAAVSRKTRFNWWLARQGFAQAAMGPKDEVPLRELGLAGNNESRSTFNQWLAWCEGPDWVDPIDGFAYGEVIRNAKKQPFCSCWVADQGVCATETGVRALMGTLRLQNPRLFVIKEPFDNVTLLTSPEAVQNHFPTMLNWLNMGRRQGRPQGRSRTQSASQPEQIKRTGLTRGA